MNKLRVNQIFFLYYIKSIPFFIFIETLSQITL